MNSIPPEVSSSPEFVRSTLSKPNPRVQIHTNNTVRFTEGIVPNENNEIIELFIMSIASHKKKVT